jgi:hypothetical protein
MSLRVTPATKLALEATAAASGRSLSQEAEFRIDQSFRNQEYLDQAMALAYGPRLTVLLAVMGRAMNEIGRLAPFPSNWMDQPHIFQEAAGAAGEVIDAFRPPGRSGLPHPIAVAGIVRPLLRAINDPENAPGELKDWAAPLHAKMKNAPPLRIMEGAAEHLKTRGLEDSQ